MTIPKVVVFDLGKVLVDFDYSIAARRIARRSAMTVAGVQSLIESSPLLVRLETGRMTDREFFDAVCGASGFAGTMDEFAEFFADIFTPIEPMVRLHSTLRAAGMPTCIFSNTNVLAVQHIRRQFQFFATFDDYIFSFEAGAMKPDAAIYEVAERRTNRCGEEILYIDDRAENVEAGAKRGWQVILQESPDQTRAALGRLGLINAST